MVNEVLPDGQVLHLQLEEQGRECDKEVQLLDRKCLITDVPDDAIERTTVDNISNKAPPSASTDEIATNTHEQRVDVTPPVSD